LKKYNLFRLALPGLVFLVSVGCGFASSVVPTTTPPTRLPAATLVEQTSQVPTEQTPEPGVTGQQTGHMKTPGAILAEETGCEEFFRFCVTTTVSGSVNASAVAGVGSNTVDNCTAWAQDGAARILELPLMLGAGDTPITVALARIAAYTGPGEYELQAVATGGAIPDMFPTVDVGGRSFTNGAGSTARVVIASDGSGTLEAKELTEIGSLFVAEPDPTAWVDISMRWTCQEP